MVPAFPPMPRITQRRRAAAAFSARRRQGRRADAGGTEHLAGVRRAVGAEQPVGADLLPVDVEAAARRRDGKRRLRLRLAQGTVDGWRLGQRAEAVSPGRVAAAD
jgi:hypothetical protein